MNIVQKTDYLEILDNKLEVFAYLDRLTMELHLREKEIDQLSLLGMHPERLMIKSENDFILLMLNIQEALNGLPITFEQPTKLLFYHQERKE
jgi:hypothetical protein